MNRYDDGGPNLQLCLEAQQYYKQQNYATRVKAAGLLNASEAIQLAGVDSMTVAPDLLRLLSKIDEPEANLADSSIFEKENDERKQEIETQHFVNDESKYREAFARSYDGKGAWKTKEVRRRRCLHVKYYVLLTWFLEAIEIFCKYQVKAEDLLRNACATATAQ